MLLSPPIPPVIPGAGKSSGFPLFDGPDDQMSGWGEEQDRIATGLTSNPHRLSESIQERPASSPLPDVSMTRLYVLRIPPAAFVLVVSRTLETKQSGIDPTKTAEDAGVAQGTPCLNRAKSQDEETTDDQRHDAGVAQGTPCLNRAKSQDEETTDDQRHDNV